MRIIHPRPDHGRQKFIGVEFVDGFAEVEELDPEVEASLLQHGFTIEKDLTSDDAEKASKPRKTKKAASAIDVGSVVALTDEAIALIGGDTDSRARVVELGEDAALVEWLTASESPITSISLSLLKPASDED